MSVRPHKMKHAMEKARVLKFVNYKIIGVVIRNNKKHIIKEIIFGENYLTPTLKSKNSVALKFIND